MELPATKISYQVAQVLVKKGYLAEVRKKTDKMTVVLKYLGKRPAVMGLKRVSKPGGRVYSGASDQPRVRGGLGINILSTPKGVMDGGGAKKLKTGGEILAQVW